MKYYCREALELLITIVEARPDEISEEESNEDESNTIRLWWD